MNSNSLKLIVPLLILAVLLTAPFTSKAHTITVDGDPSDWTGTPPTSDNTYTISSGEWIWRDASGDERTDFANPDPRVDITEFRITSNSTHLFFLIKFDNLDVVGQDGAPGILITIDMDMITGSGETWFGYNSETQVAQNNDSNWEYQVAIDLANGEVSDGQPVYGDGVEVWNGGSALDVLDTGWNDVSTSSSVFVASTTNNAVEIAIAWSDLGVADSSTVGTLRFEVGVVRVNPTGDAWDVNGASDILDCITTTGPNTWDEVQDGYVDYYFDVTFNSVPEPIPEPFIVGVVVAATAAVLSVVLLRKYL